MTPITPLFIHDSFQGTARRIAVSVRDCGICGGELKDAMAVGSQVPKEEVSVQLSCKHLFHQECVRGWLIVGKKDSCPTCQEKVDLRHLAAEKAWETKNLNWIQMLDLVRYMVVWQPTILTVLHFVFHLLHLDMELEGEAEPAAGGNDTAGGGVVGRNGSYNVT
jgi:hypothetical protein